MKTKWENLNSPDPWVSAEALVVAKVYGAIEGRVIRLGLAENGQVQTRFVQLAELGEPSIYVGGFPTRTMGVFKIIEETR